MYHSINFETKNTWEDWHLVPSSRPTPVMPTQKTRYLDIPGLNGALDISNALTGYPIYNNREGSFEFYVMNDYPFKTSDGTTIASWNELYSEIANYIHGKTMRMILEDDPTYYYIGRFFMKQWTSSVPRSTITIDYNVEPYKWSVFESADPNWLWDPFNFDNDYISSSVFRDITINFPNDFHSIYFPDVDVGPFPIDFFGNAPICPEIYVTDMSKDIYMKYRNADMHIDIEERLFKGSNIFPHFIIHNLLAPCVIDFRGIGTFNISFRRGRL